MGMCTWDCGCTWCVACCRMSVYVHIYICLCVLLFASMCAWCLEGRQQSNNSQSIQSARQRPVIPNAWWKTEKLRCCTHTHTPTVFIFCALGVSWYPRSFWHVINAFDIGAQTEFSRMVLFSHSAPNENRIFLQTHSIAQLPIDAHSQPRAMCACWCEQGLIYVLKPITISCPWKICCFLLEAVFFLI